MRRLRIASVHLIRLGIGLSLALAAMACNLISQAPIPDFVPLAPSQPSASQAAEGRAEAPPAFEEQSVDEDE